MIFKIRKRADAVGFLEGLTDARFVGFAVADLDADVDVSKVPFAMARCDNHPLIAVLTSNPDGEHLDRAGVYCKKCGARLRITAQFALVIQGDRVVYRGF